ncbi:MAG: ACP S-malonyltransferase, partial [Oscillospiraceae bacterium]
MGKIAFLFAGQGAQYPGMGKSLYQTSSAAAKVFDENEQTHPGIIKDCFEADAQRLAQTDVTQPCLYTVDLAAAAALVQAGIQPQGVTGFSLGEMAALTFARVFSASEGISLVSKRGVFMQQAAQQNSGTMAAVLKLENEKIEEICKQFKNVYPANYNCNGQLVVSGSSEEMPQFCEAVKQAGGMAR